MNSSIVNSLVGVSPNSTSLRGEGGGGEEEDHEMCESDPYIAGLQPTAQVQRTSSAVGKTLFTDLFLRVCSHTLTTLTISLVVRRNSCIRAATRRAEDGEEAQWGHIMGYLYLL